VKKALSITWGQTEVNREEWIYVIKVAKALRRPHNKGVGK
jgi:hypothetical protein